MIGPNGMLALQLPEVVAPELRQVRESVPTEFRMAVANPAQPVPSP